MAGAGIQVSLDKDYQTIINALARMSDPDKRGPLGFIGGELADISEGAFQNEADPGTGEKWAALRRPRGEEAATPGTTRPILWDSGHLGESIHRESLDDAVIVGSNKDYATTHRRGDSGRRIPPRPYVGIPPDFERRLLGDPAVLELPRL